MTRSLVHRVTALVLSWTVPGSSAPAPQAPAVSVSEATSAPTLSQWPALPLLAAAAAKDAVPEDAPKPGPETRPQAGTQAGRAGSDKPGARMSEGQACTSPVRPILECVVDNGGGSYTAHFGYQNDNSTAATIPIGAGNKFSPVPQDRGQPSVFQPGRTPYYPNAAFSVGFPGSDLVWTLKGPDGTTRTSTASSSSTRCAPACGAQFFGPKRYNRTSGPPNDYTDVVSVPAGVPSPYTLRIQNGESDGSHRISSAWVWVNGVQVVSPSDLNQNVAELVRVVALTPSTTLRVKLQSAPGSYLTIGLCGAAPSDTTPPQVAVALPAAGSLTSDRTPPMRATYSDAGGIALPSVRLFVDGVERTSVFSVSAGEAQGELPEALALADGAHTLRAEVKDLAGNAAQAESTFTVDGTPPSLGVGQPADGSVAGSGDVPVQVEYSDWHGLDLASFAATLDGQPVALTVGAGSATGQLVALAEGAHTLAVSLRDQASNLATASSTFEVDLQAPTLTIVTPVAEALLASGAVPVSASYVDSRLDVSSFKATLDGVDRTAAFSVGPSGATATLPGVADGAHALVLEIKDLAGHLAQQSVAFTVDTAAPTITLSAPAQGAFLATATPAFALAYADAGAGLDPASFVFRVDGVDLTSRLVAGPNGAIGTLPAADALGQGPHTATAEIRDLAGNQATAPAVSFTVDTQAPSLSFTAPGELAFVGAYPVQVDLAYAEGVSGLEAGSLRVMVDGVDRSAAFSAGPSSASAALGADLLSEGAHTLVASLRDQAGNQATASLHMTVDTEPPVLALTSPVEGAFVRQVQVEVLATVADEDTQITGTCQAGSQGAPATFVGQQLSCSLTLAEGANEIVVTVSDRLGHPGSASVHVTLDTGAPQLTVLEPIEGQLVMESSISVRGQVQDANAVTVTVDGLPALVENGSFVAEGVPVGAGPDVDILVHAEDAAGNPRDVTVRVRVDRQAPTLAITSPADGAVVGGASVTVEGTVSDESPVSVLVNSEPASVSCSPGSPASLVEGLDVSLRRGQAGDGKGRERLLALAGSCTWSAQVSVPDGSLTIEALARDAAGNEQAASITVSVDRTPPVIVVSAPTATTTNASSVQLAGTVSDASDVTLTLDGQPLLLSGGAFAAQLALPSEGAFTFTLVARDAAQNESSRVVALTVDRTQPSLQVLQPAEGAVVGSLPLLVRGLATDASALSVSVNGEPATFTQNAWEAVLAGLGEGQQALEVVATDAAGNANTVLRELRLDTLAPQIAIVSPQSGLLTAAASVTVNGTLEDQAAPSVTVGDVTASVQWPCAANGACSGTFNANVPLQEGDSVLVARATDVLGRSSTAQIVVTRDSQAPSVALQAPEQLQRGQSAEALASVDDASALASVVLTLGGQILATFTAPPYAASFEVPPGALNGELLLLEAVATDAAGNLGQASRLVRVVGGGVLVGQVLADDTGLPLAGAGLRVFAQGQQVAELQADESGRYSVQVSSDTALVRAELDGFTSAQRVVTLQAGVGTVAVDARLRPLAAAQVVPASGATLDAPVLIVPPQTSAGASPAAAASAPSAAAASSPEASVSEPAAPTGAELIALRFAQVRVGGEGVVAANGNAPGAVAGPLRAANAGGISVAVPAGAVQSDTSFRLTSLSAQGLPALLPLGFSPLLAFDLRRDDGAGVALPLGLSLTGLAHGDGSAQLVEYREALHGWVVAARDLQIAAGSLSAELLELGVFALVVADAGEPVVSVPAVGEALVGVPAVALAATATAESVVDPAVLPPTGGTAVGSVTVSSGSALPSGTLVSAEVSESYLLTNGQTAESERRLEDVLLYRVPSAAEAAVPGQLGAVIPITPSRVFEATELQSGAVKVLVKSGREGVRGETGGSDAVQIVNGAVRLLVAAGALPQNTALSVRQVEVGAQVPQAEGLQALGQVETDFSGQTLALSAELSLACAALDCTGGPFALAQIVHVSGVPYVEVVSLAEVVGARLVSVAYPGLRGVREGGQYVFYRLPGPLGFVGGTTTAQANGSAVRGLVRADGLPFAALAGAGGAYVLASLPGAVNVTASVSGTSLAGTGSATVVAGSTTPLDLALSGTVTVAITRPLNGAVAVEPSRPLELETSSPLLGSSVSGETVKLYRVDEANGNALLPVSVRLVLSASRKLLSIQPEGGLSFATPYRLEILGLVDAYGGAVTVSPVGFRTRANEVPEWELSKLVFTVPDANGLVTVTAPAGTFPPGTIVLIIDAGNGVVVQLTVDNDGALWGELPASVEDRLFVTITDPLGHAVSFERSQYYDAATGLTTVGEGGGFIEGTHGEGLFIPEGALDAPARIKIELLEPAQYPEGTPADLGPNVHVGAVLKLESPDQPRFKKGLQLSLDRPADAPEDLDVYYHVLQRLQAPPLPDGTPVTLYQHVGEARYFPEPGVSTGEPGSPLSPGGGEGVVRTASSALTANAPQCAIPIPGPWATRQRKVVSLESELWSAQTTMAGFVNSYGALESMAQGYAFVMWEVTRLLPGSPLPGVITGKVLRAKWVAPGSPPSYLGVPAAAVTGREASGATFLQDGATLGRTNGDGYFQMTDPRYTGGPFTVSAIDPVTFQVHVGHGFQEQPQNQHTEIRGCYNQAHVNVLLPALEPPAPPPAVRVRLFKLQDGSRQELLGGLVPENEPILIGLTPERPVGLPPDQAIPYDVQELELDGHNQAYSPDPQTSGATSNRYLVTGDGPDGTYVPGSAGTVTLRIKVRRDAAPDEPFYVSYSFRVVGAGGGTTNDPLNPPHVITAQTVPKANAMGVPVTVLPRLAFSEPVTQVASNVELVEVGGGPVDVRLIGVGPGGIVPVVTDATVLTGVTLEPREGLKYDKGYVLRVKTGLLDQDTPPKSLPEPVESIFTTFKPEGLPTESNTETLVGLAVSGDRLYAAQTEYRGGILGALPYMKGHFKTYDISDPLQPTEILEAQQFLHAPPLDLSLNVSADGETKRVAVAMMSSVAPSYDGDGNYEVWTSPGNVYLFDVGENESKWVGAVSLTSGIVDGVIQRVVLKDTRLYAATWRKGLQMVDTLAMTDGFPENPYYTYGGFLDYILLRGTGWGMENVVTIDVWSNPEAPEGQRQQATLFGLDVADVNWNGTIQQMMFATGRPANTGLVLADPGNASIVKQIALPPMTQGGVVKVGTLAGRPIALVGGRAPGMPGILQAVDLAPLATGADPVVISSLTLTQASDLLIVGNQVIVATDGGTAYVISYSDPLNPQIVAELSNVGSRIQLTDSGLLLSTSGSMIANPNDPLRGIHATALGAGSFITSVTPTPIILSASNEVFKDVQLAYKVVPPGPDLTQAEVHIDVRDGGRVATLPGALDASGSGTVTWPSGAVVDMNRTYEAKAEVLSDGQPLPAFAKRLVFERVPLAVLAKDRFLRIQFALPEQGLFEENRYAVDVFVAAAAGTFPEAAAFTVSSQMIQDAFPNIQASWPVADGPEVSRLWYTRKLDKMQLPPGTNTQIRRQAFEIATMLSGYAEVRVVVRSETSQDELRREEVTAAPDARFAEIFTKINRDLRRIAGEPLSDAPLAFGEGLAAQGAGDVFIEKMGGLTARVVGFLADSPDAFPADFYVGLYDGFMDTLKGDTETVVFLNTAYNDPKTAARLMAEFFIELWKAMPSKEQLAGWICTLFEKADNFGNAALTKAFLFTWDNGAYYGGYITGLVVEQALTGALITAGLGAATATAGGIGAAVGPPLRIALTGIKTGAWFATALRRVVNFVRAVGYGLQGVAKAGELLRPFTKAVLEFALRERNLLTAFATKYQKVDLLFEAMGKVVVVSGQRASRAVRGLETFDRMAEAPAVRFVGWVGKRTEAEADIWFGRWTSLQRGKTAVKDAFEAHAALQDAPEGVAHALVLGADRPYLNTPTNYAKEYVAKYGAKVNETLARLMLSVDDVRYSGDVIAGTVRAHAEAAIVGGVDKEAVEGSARLIRDAVGALTPEETEVLLKAVLRESRADSNTLLTMVLQAENSGQVKGFAKGMQRIPCVVP